MLVKFLLLVIIVAMSVAMSACSWVSHDGAPAKFPDVSEIEDAKPFVEPTSRGGNPESYMVNGVRYFTLKDRQGFSQTGIASWYGTKFHGRLTSNGERYDMYQMTAAHKTLPIPSYVKVTNLENDKSIMVRVNDRGPFVDDRIIDLSYVAAIKLGMTQAGTARVRIDAWSARSAAPEAAAVSAQIGKPPTEVATTTASTLAAAGGRRYYLQLGAFVNRLNAQKLQSKLLSETQEPVELSPAQTTLGMMYRVRLGPYGQREKISSLEKQLRQLGFNQQTRIVDTSVNRTLTENSTHEMTEYHHGQPDLSDVNNELP